MVQNRMVAQKTGSMRTTMRTSSTCSALKPAKPPVQACIAVGFGHDAPSDTLCVVT